MLSTVRSIPTVELCETPVTSMLFDWAHTICYDFMRSVCRKCGGQMVDEGETRRRIQRALKTLDEWTPSHRRSQTKEALALYPGIGHALRASLVFMADSLAKHGFEVSQNYDFSAGDFIHDTLTSVGRDPLVLTLAYFRRTPEAYTARWLLHRKCMREALVAALAPTPPADCAPGYDADPDDPSPGDSVSNIGSDAGNESEAGPEAGAGPGAEAGASPGAEAGTDGSR